MNAVYSGTESVAREHIERMLANADGPVARDFLERIQRTLADQWGLV
jgi:hypothetical protein